MMKTLPALLLLSAVLGTALPPPLAAQTTPTGPASAPPPPAGAQPPASGPTPEAARQSSRAADRAALFEARLAAMHAGLMLTPDQEKLWPAVDGAVRGYVVMRESTRDRRIDAEQDREERTGAAEPNEDPVAALMTYSEGLMERAQAFKALSEAVGPLYAALSDDQRNRIPLLLRDIAPRTGPLTDLAARFEGDAPGSAATHDDDASARRAQPFGREDRAEGEHRRREGRRDWGEGGRSLYRDRSETDGSGAMSRRMNDRDERDGEAD